MTMDDVLALPTFEEQYAALRAFFIPGGRPPDLIAHQRAVAALIGDPRYIEWLALHVVDVLKHEVKQEGGDQ